MTEQGFLDKLKKLFGEELQNSSSTLRELLETVREARDTKDDVALLEEKIVDVENFQNGLWQRIVRIEEHLELGTPPPLKLKSSKKPSKKTPKRRAPPS